MSVKEVALQTIEKMPADASWRDVLYTLYVRQQVADGMTEIAAGKFIPHAKVREAILNGNNLDPQRT
jgi:predicted transcriptional regulator